ncbi:MAG: hypothetical protein H6739_38905 [Alphaproteobacteria bacterium]|nr:hypothetical protein [Alphaproteobacteria bacterium]
MIRTLLLLGLGAFTGLAHAGQRLGDCTQQTTLADLNAAAARGEQAFADLDVEALNAARDDALEALPCLGESISPSDAAAFHRLMGMSAFVARERQQVTSEFHAARKLQPGYEVPESVAPPGHPLIEAYNDAVLADEGALRTPYPPVGGYVTVGGVRGAPRPANSPVILQVYESGDTLVETLYLPPGETLPEWGPAPLPEDAPNVRMPLLIATGGTLLAAGGMYGVAKVYSNQFYDTTTPTSELSDLRGRTNTFAFGSVVFFGAAVGLGTVTILKW